MQFVSEASENAPAGTQVVFEYEIVGNQEFLERFEVRLPGGDQPVTIRNRWRRTP